jgi:adenylate cyclase
VAHGKTVPFLPAIQLLREVFGIGDRDADREAREKVAGRLLLLDPGFRDVLPLVFDFLGVAEESPAAAPAPTEDGGGSDARRQLFAFVRRLVRSLGEREPILLMVDDLHWIDPGSDELMAQLVEAVSGTRALLLVTFRPDYKSAWVGRSYYQQLPLRPLTSEGIDEMLRDRLGSDPSVARLSDRLRTRASGNPLFIEELIQSLVEAGSLVGARGDYRLVGPVEALEIPNSVQSVLAARLDRLPDREKSVLQASAVIGDRFAESVLRRVVELPETELMASIDALRHAELIYDESIYPEAEYGFVHAVIREVCAGSQLAEQRRGLHAAVARAIEAIHAEKLDEHAALLAHHWELAGDAPHAVHWHERAARRTATAHPAEATRHWLRVRELLRDAEDGAETRKLRATAIRQVLNLGWHLGMDDAEVAEVFEEGRALAEGEDDPRALGGLYRAYALQRLLSGSTGESAELLEKAVPLAERAGDAAMQASLLTSLVLSNTWSGRLDAALEGVDQLLERTRDEIWLGAETLGYSPFLWAANMHGVLLSRSGRLHEAEAAIQRAIELARFHGDSFVLGHAYQARALLKTHRGDVDGALGDAGEAIRIFEEMGSAHQATFGHLRLGAAQVLAGHFAEAVQSLEKTLETARDQHQLASEPEILAQLAEAYLGSGDAERALEASEQALDSAREHGVKLFECDAHLARAHVLLRSQGAAAAESIRATLQCADELVDETGARVHEPFVQLARAELAGIEGDASVRESALGEARRMLAAMGATGHEQRLAAGG